MINRTVPVRVLPFRATEKDEDSFYGHGAWKEIDDTLFSIDTKYDLYLLKEKNTQQQAIIHKSM
jgi:hypothetical protein